MLATVICDIYYPCRIAPGEPVVLLRPILGRLGQTKGHVVMLSDGSTCPVKSIALDIPKDQVK